MAEKKGKQVETLEHVLEDAKGVFRRRDRVIGGRRGIVDRSHVDGLRGSRTEDRAVADNGQRRQPAAQSLRGAGRQVA